MILNLLITLLLHLQSDFSVSFCSLSSSETPHTCSTNLTLVLPKFLPCHLFSHLLSNCFFAPQSTRLSVSLRKTSLLPFPCTLRPTNTANDKWVLSLIFLVGVCLWLFSRERPFSSSSQFFNFSTTRLFAPSTSDNWQQHHETYNYI